jgi:hypothetical protein
MTAKHLLIPISTLKHPRPARSSALLSLARWRQPVCAPALYRALPQMDLVGTLVSDAGGRSPLVTAVTEAACRVACCSAPTCTGYAYASGMLRLASVGADARAEIAAPCALYATVTALVPSSFVSSGALLSEYS